MPPPSHRLSRTAEHAAWLQFRLVAKATVVPFEPRWNDFASFLKDVGKRPSPQHQLRRFISADGFTKLNCRWQCGPDKERAAQRRSEWLAANPERRKKLALAYYYRNKPKFAVNVRNRRARLREVEGTHTPADIGRILLAQRGRCAYCKCKITPANMAVDHIFPVSKGGHNGPSNLQIACNNCNSRKSAKDPIEYARSTGRLI